MELNRTSNNSIRILVIKQIATIIKVKADPVRVTIVIKINKLIKHLQRHTRNKTANKQTMTKLQKLWVDSKEMQNKV